MDQRGRHIDEFRSQVDVHFPRFVQVFQVLRGDGGDGDILDVDLLLADQIQQQIERSLILLQVKIKGR